MAEPLALRFGELVIDLERYQVRLADTPLLLSYREYGLLVYLAGRSGQTVPKRQLLLNFAQPYSVSLSCAKFNRQEFCPTILKHIVL